MPRKPTPAARRSRSLPRQVSRIQIAEEISNQLRPGERADFSITKRGQYAMLTVTEAAMTGDETGPIHVVVSMDFIRFLPQYDLTSLAKDAFWTIVGRLGEYDEDKGEYPYMNAYGEVTIRQDEVAGMLGVTRRSINPAIGQLMDRNFLWKAGRGKYQIHPHILYFGSSHAQAEAIGYASARFEDRKLPGVPRPGDVIAREITENGVTDILA